MANEKSTSQVESVAVTSPIDISGAGLTPPEERDDSLKAHWKSLAACALMAMCPFQYGIDFGLIGSIQAMVGFLQASLRRLEALASVEICLSVFLTAGLRVS